MGRLLAICLGVMLGGCASAPQMPFLAGYDGSDGGLQFAVQPADAEVFVDAERMGTVAEFSGDKVLWLPRGLHAVEVTKTGYFTFFRQVQTSSGLVEVFITTLREAREVETNADRRR
jgi:hypothetical protein